MDTGLPVCRAPEADNITIAMITEFATHFCYVSDMDRALAFYRDVLKLPVEHATPYWSSFTLPNGRLGLHPRNPGQVEGGPPGWVIGLRVDDIRAFRAHLEDHGVSVRSEFHQTPAGVVLDFDDPDGNRLQAFEAGSQIA